MKNMFLIPSKENLVSIEIQADLRTPPLLEKKTTHTILSNIKYLIMIDYHNYVYLF